MPAGIGYGNSRYTPPKSRDQKTPGRQRALKNKAMGLGAGNMGTSATARNAQNAALDRMERIRAFDANQTGRATPKVRMVAGAGSGPNYTGPSPAELRGPAGSGYGSLVTRGQAAAVGRATKSGRLGRSPTGGVATRTKGYGPAALGQRAPLALPAAGQSMASPAGTGYGSLVTRGDVQRNMDGLAAKENKRLSTFRARNRPGTAIELYRGGPPDVVRGSQNAPITSSSRGPLALGPGPSPGPGPGRTTTPPGDNPSRAIGESIDRSKPKPRTFF